MFRKKKGFSLVELSVSILIIGIIIIGIFAGDILIKKSRISSARTMTQSSPVNSMKSLSFWFESSMEDSFDSSELDDGVAITTWYDKTSVSVTKNNATQAISDNKPTFANSINRIHAVAFDGTDDYFNVDASFLNGSDYTIFVVDKRTSAKADNYFIGDSTVDTENENLILGYSAEGVVTHYQAGDNSYISSVPVYDGGSNEPKIYVFRHASSSGKTTYINGMLAATSNDTANLSNISTIAIGKAYAGELGEIIAFDKALGGQDR